MCVAPVSDAVVGPYLVCPGPVEVDRPSKALHKPRVLSAKILCDLGPEASGILAKEAEETEPASPCTRRFHVKRS